MLGVTQDNLSRGNLGAIEVLKKLAPKGRFQFVEADLGDFKKVRRETHDEPSMNDSSRLSLLTMANKIWGRPAPVHSSTQAKGENLPPPGD